MKKVKRIWHYVQNPKEYEIECAKCGGHNIEWSEWDGHIWCYDCKKDIKITKRTNGVFGGPIPIQAAALVGMCFDRWDMVNKQILTWDDKKKEYVPKKLQEDSNANRNSVR